MTHNIIVAKLIISKCSHAHGAHDILLSLRIYMFGERSVLKLNRADAIYIAVLLNTLKNEVQMSL